MMHGPNHVNRMVRIKAPRSPQDYSSPDPTQTTAVEASSPTHSSVRASLPVSTAALAGIVTFLTIALLLVLGVCIYRRRKYSKERSNPSVDFDRNAFTEKKNVPPPMVHRTFEAKSPSYQSSISSHESEKSGAAYKSQTSPKFRITNDSEGTDKMPAVPKAVAEKRRPSRSKPWIKSLNLNLDEVVRSPPPSYDIANSGGSQFLVPIPSEFPPEKAKYSPTPPTPPANRKSHASTSKKSKVQTLVVPKEKVPAPIPSPARSESFAPKNLIPPPPAAAGPSKGKSSSPASANPFASKEDDRNGGNKTPRMMKVIAYFTPTLTDELRVQVGDTVRVLEEYQDGWCFAQYVGKADAPKGVVPLVCLEERSRVVPVAHTRSPNGSLSSLNNWR